MLNVNIKMLNKQNNTVCNLLGLAFFHPQAELPGD